MCSNYSNSNALIWSMDIFIYHFISGTARIFQLINFVTYIYIIYIYDEFEGLNGSASAAWYYTGPLLNLFSSAVDVAKCWPKRCHPSQTSRAQSLLHIFHIVRYHLSDWVVLSSSSPEIHPYSPFAFTSLLFSSLRAWELGTIIIIIIMHAYVARLKLIYTAIKEA